MSFIFICPKCGAKLEAEDEWRNQEADCPLCNEKITIAPPDNDNAIADAPIRSNQQKERQETQATLNTTDTAPVEQTQEELAISFSCPKCGKNQTIPGNMIGKRIFCTGCAEEVIVCESPNAHERECPFCGKKIKKQATRCKYCKRELTDSSILNFTPNPTSASQIDKKENTNLKISIAITAVILLVFSIIFFTQIMPHSTPKIK